MLQIGAMFLKKKKKKRQWETQNLVNELETWRFDPVHTMLMKVLYQSVHAELHFLLELSYEKDVWLLWLYLVRDGWNANEDREMRIKSHAETSMRGLFGDRGQILSPVYTTFRIVPPRQNVNFTFCNILQQYLKAWHIFGSIIWT